MAKISLFWFRRDLRLEDNHGLLRALSNSNNVQPIFIFDKNILSKLEDTDDRRISFIHDRIERLSKELKTQGSSLWVFHDDPLQVFKKLTSENEIESLYANRDYEPYARERDREIFDFLDSKGIAFKAHKDHVIFDREEILKGDGTPYTVYSPYAKKWKTHFQDKYLTPFPSEQHLNNLNKGKETSIPTLESMGFETHEKDRSDSEIDSNIIKSYNANRDTPSIRGTSRLSVHIRFGTVSIRALYQSGMQLSEKWVNELIWREFYQMILWHFPFVTERSFRARYDHIEWINNEEQFKAWCEGKTGYPIVDAGMRELNETGFMHNRVRMIVASFLSKHLLIDWRWGEAYFARKLIDFELASNNGGWQWAAGSGVDAAPYFRVFNPYLQTEKFDPKLEYIRKWVPEFDSDDYPEPIVEHKFARKRAIDTYQRALK